MARWLCNKSGCAIIAVVVQKKQFCGSQRFANNTGFSDSSSFVNEQVHEISNHVVCATSKASYQPAHPRSLIRAFASRLSIL